MIQYFKQKIQDNKSGFKVTQHWDWKMLDGLYEKKIGYREEPYIKNDLDKLILDNPRNLEGELTLRTYRSWWGGFYKESLFSENWHFRALISNGPKNFFSPTANLNADVFAVILSKAFKLI